MKTLVIILTEEITPSGRTTTRNHVGDTELLTDELRWCLDEMRNDLRMREAVKKINS